MTFGRPLALYGLQPFSPTHTALAIPIGVQQMAFAVWLIVKGFNASAIASEPEQQPAPSLLYAARSATTQLDEQATRPPAAAAATPFTSAMADAILRVHQDWPPRTDTRLILQVIDVQPDPERRHRTHGTS